VIQELSLSHPFAALGLADALVRAVADAGYTDPTPVQRQAIPVILAGRDVLAGAQTGTGKTAGFALPLLQILAGRGGRPASKTARALILSPTRELAAQIEESVRTYGKHLPLTSTLIYGGVGMQPQVQAMAKGVDILVATPGRLLDHVGERTVDLSKVEILVLDEADRMLDMGFIRDIRKVLALLPKQRQNLLFSATFSDEIRELASGLLHDPAHVEVARRNQEAESVAQRVYLVPKDHKKDLLVHLVKEGNWFQALVFTKTKHGANRLAEQLRKADVEADAIHGNKSQGARTRALGGFKDGKVRVLVATDIAARGLDIELLPHVVNYDLPNVSEDYVHRIGRTGRAGATGEAISLVCPDDEPLLAAIEKLIRKKIERAAVPAFPRLANAPLEADARRGPPRGGRGAQEGRRDRGERGGRSEPRAARPQPPARDVAARPPRPVAAEPQSLQAAPAQPSRAGEGQRRGGGDRPANPRPAGEQRRPQGGGRDGRQHGDQRRAERAERDGRPAPRTNMPQPQVRDARRPAAGPRPAQRGNARPAGSAAYPQPVRRDAVMPSPMPQQTATDTRTPAAESNEPAKKRGPIASLLGALQSRFQSS
jgi:ATP-dependent RNA helicase RhlE